MSEPLSSLVYPINVDSEPTSGPDDGYLSGLLAELEGHRGIFYSNRGGADWRFVYEGQTRIADGQMGLVLNNDDMMRDAAIAGLGITLLPMFIVSEALQSGVLKVIDVGVEAEREHIYVAHADGQNPSAKLRALAAWLKEAFGSPPYWDKPAM